MNRNSKLRLNDTLEQTLIEKSDFEGLDDETDIDLEAEPENRTSFADSKTITESNGEYKPTANAAS